MPTLSNTYAIPSRGSNDDFNNTFTVTTSGPIGLNTCSDAWVARTGTFVYPPTSQENLFMHDWAQSPRQFVYYAYGISLDANTALSNYVTARNALTYQQIANPADNTGLRFNGNGVAINAWQCVAKNNGSTTWGRGPAKVRAPLNLGYIAVSNGAGKYVAANGTSTVSAYAVAWNNFILNYYGSLPTDPLDPVFTTDIYYWGMLTAPLNPVDVNNPAGTQGSAFLGPYIDAVKNRWGPYAGI